MGKENEKKRSEKKKKERVKINIGWKYNFVLQLNDKFNMSDITHGQST